MADVKMVVVDGVRYREADAPKVETKQAAKKEQEEQKSRGGIFGFRFSGLFGGSKPES